VLRDQFVFMSRAGFDAFEVKKAPTPTPSPRHEALFVFYQPTGDGRVTALTVACAAAFGERRQ